MEILGELIHDNSVKIKFTTTLSDNSEVELVPNGKNMSVNEENVKDYIKLVEERRHVEF